jgi:hypothetical protein
MNFDFFIQDINFKFDIRGKGDIKLFFNGTHVDNCHVTKNIKENNVVEIMFSKDDPSDVDSYAILEQVFINGFDCVDRFKEIEYHIDKSKHTIADNVIPNNLYFGYIGRMTFTLEHKNDQLSKAAWKLADKEFEYVKWPMRGNNFRQKDFDTVLRDARFMFVGVHNLKIDAITDLYEKKLVKDLIEPIGISTSRTKLEKWLNNGCRFKLRNLDKFDHFTLSTGVHESLQSFIYRSDNLFVTKKNFEGNGEMFEGKTIKVFDLLNDEIIPESSVIIEIPSPWYNTKKLISFIEKAKKQKCRIAIDATWLSMTNERIDLDLKNVDEFYFSMNKAWPIDNFRPSFRWSKEYVHDAQTFATLNCSYPKMGFQIFFQLMEHFDVDWTYNYFKDDADEICSTFDLKKTNILWFTKKQNRSETKKYVGKHYHLEEFVSLVKLLQYKNKYFW